MNESLFKDASPTNLHVKSPISTYSGPWIETSLTCAPAQVVVFHLLHTDWMQLYTVSEKVHLWFWWCCNFICYFVNKPTEYSQTILTQSWTIIRIVVIVSFSRRIRSWLFLPVIVASAKILFLSPCPFPYSSRFLTHVCSCMYSCQLK